MNWCDVISIQLWKHKVVDNKFFWTDSTSKIGSNEKRMQRETS